MFSCSPTQTSCFRVPPPTLFVVFPLLVSTWTRNQSSCWDVVPGPLTPSLYPYIFVWFWGSPPNDEVHRVTVDLPPSSFEVLMISSGRMGVHRHVTSEFHRVGTWSRLHRGKSCLRVLGVERDFRGNFGVI